MAITDADVEAIVEVDPTITDLSPFISASKVLMDAATATADYPTATYDSIHTWLAAHFYCIRDSRRSSETADDVREEFQYKLGRGLECTMYGQTAVMMDFKGGLAKIDKENKNGGKKTMSVTWVGTDPDEVTS